MKGFKSYRARAVAARDTRARKERQPVEDLMARWRQELADIGLDLGDIDYAVRRNHDHRITTELTDRDLDALAAQLLAIDGPLAADKVFARRDVMVAAAPLLYGLDPSMLARLVDKVLEHPDAIPIQPARTARDWRWAPRRVVDTERKIAKKAIERHETGSAPKVAEQFVGRAMRAAQDALGHSLTDSQLRVVSGVCRSGRSLDVVVGIAGSGKTTALDAVQTALTCEGYRVLGTATSGQAARTLGREASVESLTLASLLARLDRGSEQLDNRTVVVFDEAGMTDDQDLLRLVEATSRAGAKLVLVGDDRQLSAVGPGGSLAALVRRFGGGVWRLDDNIRQIDFADREALAELRSGDVEAAVDWLRRNDRIQIGADRPEAIGAMVDGWIGDVEKGLDTVMLAWRRSSVDALNQLGREAYEDRGWLTGPEITAPGGRRYRAGDRVVALAPVAGQVVTSEVGTVESVDPANGSLTVLLDEGRRTVLAGPFTSSQRLTHAYAATVHRSQGATVDTAHYLEEGGGRALAYVGLSRARTRSTAYAVADDLDQAVEDFTEAWSIERRQEWVIDQAVVDERVREGVSNAL